MPEFDEENPQEEIPEQPSQPEAGGDDDQQGGGRSQLDNLQDANDLRNKLSGEGGSSGEAAGGTGEATTGSGGSAAEGVTSGAGGSTAATGGAEGATVGGTAGLASEAAAATGTGAAVGGAAAGESVAGGVAAGAVTGTAGVGLSETGVGAAVGVPLLVAAAAKNKEVRKMFFRAFLGVLAAVFAVVLMPLGMAILIIFLFFFPLLGGVGTGEAAGAGTSSTILKITKTASVTSIPKGTANAQVTYTIVVSNTSDKPATAVTVDDTFSSTPQANFADEIVGYDKTFTVDIAAGTNVSKTYTVTIPHTDFDPGWILFNSAKSSGTIAGGTEKSTAGATVIIGNPPTGPPAFSPLHNPDSTGGYKFGDPVINSHGQATTHEGLDIHDSSDRNILSPFAQPATVTLNTFDSGYGWYVILQCGEWEVYLTHMVSQSSLTVGQTVDATTLVGIEGDSGYAQGIHIHYEVHQNGTPVDPALYNALTPHP